MSDVEFNEDYPVLNQSRYSQAAPQGSFFMRFLFELGITSETTAKYVIFIFIGMMILTSVGIYLFFVKGNVVQRQPIWSNVPKSDRPQITNSK